MSIVRIHISVRQMCVMCVELWRVEESSLPSTPHSLPSQAVLAAVVYYKPVIYITCSFVLLLTFCQSVAHFGIPLSNSERNTTPIPLEGNLSGHPKSLVYDYLASSWHSEPAFKEGKPSKPASSSEDSCVVKVVLWADSATFWLKSTKESKIQIERVSS